ncbi:C4-dicarboxylate ABC transporter [Roseomonas hellenica]|uniref:C4-dicarboxylate ABC transporter n=2 Tax=Plastoroseomonas hellenica TaxID=2687306 RepID=A0ABS5F052_9PROT|nr:C4-dicarboxylate ABC transporter [Plastoroseomonas hellenica]MBR0665919.1 C4-dicarboxylate ABC transporter [Plastoroseomonas hellenica]
MRHGALALGLALAAMAPAAAQERFTLRLNHVLGPSEPFHEGFQTWARRVQERTNGGLTIRVFHSAQLGVEEDIIEQMRQGAAIGQNTDAARLGTYVRGMAVLNGPYFAETIEDVAKLAESPTIRRWQQELAASHGLQVVCFDWVQGHRHFYTNRPVRTPQDLAGQRIRTPPAPIWQESVRALGAAPVAMAFGEMYPALQQRAIDGVELVWNNIPGGRFNEVIRYVSETGHILLINFQVVGSRFFQSLPEAHRTALVEECRRAGQETSRRIAEREQEVRRQMLARGMTAVDNVDMAAFRRAGARAYEVLGLAAEREAVLRDVGRN